MLILWPLGVVCRRQTVKARQSGKLISILERCITRDPEQKVLGDIDVWSQMINIEVL